MALLLGISWLTCALAAFARDLGQAVSTALQFVFWATPIVWNIQAVPQPYRVYLKLNPVFYIVQGYRDSMVEGVWAWERGWYTLYFWLAAGGFLALGGFVFKRLRPHFANVL
jgi:lipopolysaccharide transport system permease protein/teichoic acid transport system permease protein